MLKIINGVLIQEFPNGTGLQIVNGVPFLWDEEEAAGGWSGCINTITSIAKINNVPVANILKVNGVS